MRGAEVNKRSELKINRACVSELEDKHNIAFVEKFPLNVNMNTSRATCIGFSVSDLRHAVESLFIGDKVIVHSIHPLNGRVEQTLLQIQL